MQNEMNEWNGYGRKGIQNSLALSFIPISMKLYCLKIKTDPMQTKKMTMQSDNTSKLFSFTAISVEIKMTLQ